MAQEDAGMLALCQEHALFQVFVALNGQVIAYTVQIQIAVAMSMKRSNFLGPPVVKRPSKNKLKGRRSLVTSWFASPGDLSTDDLVNSSGEDKCKR